MSALCRKCTATQGFPNQGRALPRERHAAKFGGSLAPRATRCPADAAVKFTPLPPAALPLEVAPRRQAKGRAACAHGASGSVCHRHKLRPASRGGGCLAYRPAPWLRSAAPCGACRSLRTWDLCGLTHPSSLVEWNWLKMMQIRGFPRSAASSTRGWSRVVPMWQTGPKMAPCGQIRASFAPGQRARRG